MKFGSRPIKAFAGLRNTTEPERFAQGELVSATNIELDNTGKLSTRAGTTRVATGDAHSLWFGRQQGFVVLDGELHAFASDGTTALGIDVGARVVYIEVGPTVYWSDGVQSGAIQSGVPRPWGLAVPAPAEVSLSAGNLGAGEYLLSWVGIDGEEIEGGAGEPVAVTVGANQGLEVEVPTLTGAARLRLYVSQRNGETLFAYGDYTPGAGTATISSPFVGTLALRTAGLSPAPPGQCVARFRGRLLVADSNTLWYSEPGEPELFDRARGFKLFEHPVTILAPAADGVFVATQKETAFLAGADPTEWSLTPVSSTGGILGTEVFPEARNLLDEGVPTGAALWMSPDGICLGLDGGEIKNLTGGRWVPTSATRGAALYHADETRPQFITTLFN